MVQKSFGCQKLKFTIIITESLVSFILLHTLDNSANDIIPSKDGHFILMLMYTIMELHMESRITRSLAYCDHTDFTQQCSNR